MDTAHSNIEAKESRPSLINRRRFLRIGMLASGVVTAGLIAPKLALGALGSNDYFPAKETDLIVRRPCVLSQLLDNVSGGWTRWQNFPNLGDGILSIPRLGIADGLCTITVNNTLIEGPGINVDTISLSPGDNLVIRPI